MATDRIFDMQKEYFRTGLTRQIPYRLAKLQKLKKAIIAREKDLYESLALDLGKSVMESYVDEISLVLGEIDNAIKNLNKWARPKRKWLPPLYWPATAKVVPQPYGLVLVMSPWNYPLQLNMTPLAGAMAAGNCVALKASHLAVNTNKIIKEIIEENFDADYISFTEAGPSRTAKILEYPFDFIFYTGSTRIGKKVMAAAAKNLTPLVLELGGKSPCVVDRNVDIDTAARRILWGKFVNAGQTCIAPDYLVVHSDVHGELVAAMKKVLREFYGENPQESTDYGRIVNKTHVKRISSMIKGDIVAGGEVYEDDHYVAPTIIDNVTWEDEIMEDEIFGPLLPVIEFNDLQDLIKRLSDRPSPLALYVFTGDSKTEKDILEGVPSGGACINHTLLHAAPANLPFGGVGNSGMGSYRGKATFDAFTHHRSVLKKGFNLDNNYLYPPNIRVDGRFKKLFGWLG